MAAKRLFPVDTYALVKKLQQSGVPTTQAKTITAAIIQVFNDGTVPRSEVHQKIEKVRDEIRMMQIESSHILEKATAATLLDVSLETRLTRDVLAKELLDIIVKEKTLDREIQTVRVELERTKVSAVIGTFISLCAAGIGLWSLVSDKL